MKNSEFELDTEWNISIGTPEEIISNCEVIHTVTPSRDPILELSKNRTENRTEFTHITCVGADTPGKQELSTDIITMADLICYDNLEQGFIIFDDSLSSYEFI